MTNFQFSVELTQIFPIANLVGASYDFLINYVRDIRRSGSDILVENDLANIFGRGKIDRTIETRFKQEILKGVTVEPLYPGSEIDLCYGSGPSVNYALKSKDRALLASVIQLSMLAWFHRRSDLAVALTEGIERRYRLRYPGANPDPGSEAIERTLQSITSQTSAFPWDLFAHTVEQRLRNGHSDFDQISIHLSSMTPVQLFAAMDMLYVVQSLPENRKMVIRTSKGIIVLVIWAHFLLSLSVVIKGFDKGDLAFGQAPAQVTILWAPATSSDDDNTVYLLDSGMEILLTTEPEPLLTLGSIAAEDRHRLKDYGTYCLKRIFTRRILSIPDDDWFYRRTANYVTALACLASERFVRPLSYSPLSDDDFEAIPVHRWQIISAAEMVFNSIGVENRMIDLQLEDMALQTNLLDAFLGLGDSDFDTKRPPVNLQRAALQSFEIHCLGAMVYLIANIANLECCAEASLVADLTIVGQTKLARELWPACENTSQIILGEHDLFDCLGQLLLGRKYDELSSHSRDTQFVIGDFGWSVILDNVGDKDPGECQPWMLHLRKGVPTSSISGERKYQVRDFHVGSNTNELLNYRPERVIFDRQQSFVPRCVTHVTKRTEYYTSRGDAFLASLRMQVHEDTEESMIKTTAFGFVDGTSFELAVDVRQLHKYLWRVAFTPPCSHLLKMLPVARLGSEAATANCFRWSLNDTVTERVCVLLVKGDKRSRWLAISETCRSSLGNPRRVVLRRSSTCEQCAVDYAVSRPGKWLVII